MKIDKLRTQIQFEKYIGQLSDKEFCDLENEDMCEYTTLEIDGLRWRCSQRHISHLERPLTKEMFDDNKKSIFKPNIINDPKYWLIGTLHDLAEQTRGELELKNIDI